MRWPAFRKTGCGRCGRCVSPARSASPSSPTRAGQSRRRWRLSRAWPRREVERVALLVREHNWHYQPEWNDATVRRTLARIGPAELPALWELRRADLKARGRFVEEGLKNQAEAEDRFARELLRASALKVTDLAVSGEDVMRELRLRPGPEVGRILAWLLDRVIDDPDLNTREVL